VKLVHLFGFIIKKFIVYVHFKLLVSSETALMKIISYIHTKNREVKVLTYV
jgi:hypothetical protein